MQKSLLTPTQKIEFLGFVLDSKTMNVSLAPRKMDKIVMLGKTLLTKSKISIRDLASFIGNTVAAEPGVPLAPLKYKFLEIERNKHLADSRGNYDTMITLSKPAKQLIDWWTSNIHGQSKCVLLSEPEHELFTDASLSGWGAKMADATTGGQWASNEVVHINFLELQAVLFGLQSLCDKLHNTHIRLRIDNTMAVACINKCGSTKIHLLDITQRIWEWAELRNITLSAAYIPGCDNVEADAASRQFNIDTEWMVLPQIFSKICDIYTIPKLDLFASRINCQLSDYVSWKPDPQAKYIDAFTISWNNDILYAFPPFSIIGRVLQKLVADKATVLMILPLWPTRPWFSHALHLLADAPRLLPRKCLMLPQDPSLRHPLESKLTLAVMMLSGNPMQRNKYRQKLPISYSNPGEPALMNSIGNRSKNGCHFLCNKRLIHFNHL
jgi:hypothetical protein